MESLITELKVMANSTIGDLEEYDKDKYSNTASYQEVEYHFEMGRKLAERLGYKKEELDSIPKEAVDSFAGVGNVIELADLKEGEVVVDLGSGSGMDAFYAGLKVGKKGEVFSIEMTDAQLKKSRRIKESSFFEQTHFIAGQMECLPIISNSIDTVISNGAIHLSSRKKNVFKEAERVLKCGGKLAITDIISTEEPSDNLDSDTSIWAERIGGTSELRSYRELIRHAGFEIMKISEYPIEHTTLGEQEKNQNNTLSRVSILAIKK